MLHLHTSAKTYHQEKDLPGLLCSSKQPSWTAPWPVNLNLIACRLSCCLLLPHEVIRGATRLLSAVTTCFFLTMKEPSCARLPIASLLQLLLDTAGRLQPTQGLAFRSASPAIWHSMTCHLMAGTKQVSIQHTLTGLGQYYILCPYWEPMEKNISLLTCSVKLNEIWLLEIFSS